MSENKPETFEAQADKVMRSKTMQTKVGRMTIAEYLTFEKQWFYLYMGIVLVLGILILIPLIRTFFYWVFVAVLWLGLIVITGWFGQRFAQEKKGKLSEAALGGIVIGATVGIVAGIFTFLHFMFYGYALATFMFSKFGLGIALGSFAWHIIGCTVVGLVVAVIGYLLVGKNAKRPPAPTQLH